MINNETENIVKDELKKELTDDELEILISGWIKETSSYFEILKDIIKKNIEYYKGNQTDVSNIRGNNSKAVENRIFMGIETIVPIITSQPPDMVCEAPDDSEKGNISASRLQRALMYHYERVGIKKVSERWIRDLIIKRFAVLKPFWNAQTDDVDVKVIDPRRIKFPKYGSSVDELPYTIEDLEMSYPSVRDFFGEEVAKDLLKRIPTTDRDEMKKRKVTFTIQEVWTNDMVIWRTPGKILKKEKNIYYDFVDSNKNFFTYARKPFIIDSIFQTDETIIGDTDLVVQTIPIQDNINKRKRQIEDIAAKVANPPLLIDSDVMDEETASTITNEAGIIVYGKDVAQPGKVRFETPGQLPSYLFEDLLSSRNEFDNIFGTHSTTRGVAGGKTLGQDILAKQSDMGRIDLVKRRFDYAIGELAGWWTQLMKMNYDEARFIRISGELGVIEKFTISDIENGVKVLVKSGTAIPQDEVSIRQEATNLFQLGVLDPLTLYEKLKFPDVAGTFKRLADFRTGKLFGEVSGTGAMPAESGVASSENLGQLAGAGGSSQSIGQNLAQGRSEIQQSQ